MDDTAEAIVQHLARLSPPLAYEDSTSPNGGGVEWCALCTASYPIQPDDHDPSCPWRRAVKFVKS